ncbi:hypothetical protein CEV33_3961 [Brucella grignonensis]|uniref:Uncharacterized protein n=1 Tax=Brucella grignonensis TaxID=94627 RepID=A0A256FRP5_9HYPH|nr:hypothetical protein CEV33_3961 [Brucella grignonensis]
MRILSENRFTLFGVRSGMRASYITPELIHASAENSGGPLGR